MSDQQTPRLATIGVYEFDGDTFLQRLVQADVRLLLDVRQRRGVRGPEYAWANSLRLQAALADAGIATSTVPTWPRRRSSATFSTPRMTGKGSVNGHAASWLPSTSAATERRSSIEPTSPRL